MTTYAIAVVVGSLHILELAKPTANAHRGYVDRRIEHFRQHRERSSITTAWSYSEQGIA